MEWYGYVLLVAGLLIVAFIFFLIGMLYRKKVAERELSGDVLPNLRRGCRGECRAHWAPEAFENLPEAHVVGAEVVPPLAYAVGFVHRKQGYFDAR